jgi:hypothetical protein
MKRAVKPSAGWRPQYPTLRALLLCGTLVGNAAADVSVPDRGKAPPGHPVPPATLRGKQVAPQPLPPGLPPAPQPPPRKDEK